MSILTLDVMPPRAIEAGGGQYVARVPMWAQLSKAA
jgi:hypothetical protein